MSDVTEDKCDVFVDYVQEKLPSGVQVQFELVGIFVSRGWEDVYACIVPHVLKYCHQAVF